MPLFTAIGTAVGATAATAAATGATVLGGSLAAASALGSGIAKLVGGSGDDRPTLGGPDTLSGSTAQSLASTFANPPQRPIDQPGAQSGVNPRLDAIKQRLGVMQGRLGQSRQDVATPNGAPRPATPPAVRGLPGT